MQLTVRHFDTSGAARPAQGPLSAAWGVASAFGAVVAALLSIGFHRGQPMHRIAQHWVVMLLAGLALLAYSTLALAQQSPSSFGPDWSIIATAALGVVTLLVGAYAKGIEGRLGRTEVQLNELHTMVMRDYHNKTDSERALRDGFAVLRAEISAISNTQNSMYGELQRIRAVS